MKAIVDRLSAELTDRYVHYLEAFMVDLWSETDFIEFRSGFPLHGIPCLHRFKPKVACHSQWLPQSALHRCGRFEVQGEVVIVPTLKGNEESLSSPSSTQKVVICDAPLY